MKTGTSHHPKLNHLCRLLSLRRWQAIGLLNAVWDFACDFSPQGDIGKWSDVEIGASIEWEGDFAPVAKALCDSGWIDTDTECRLLIHDWKDHAPKYIKDRLDRQGVAILVAKRRETADISHINQGKPNQGKGRETKGIELSISALTICNLLKDKIITNDPKAKTPDAFVGDKGWGRESRLLLESDGREFNEVCSVIEWASANSFWKSNILSMGKLREQYPKLRLQMQGASNARANPNQQTTPAYNTGVVAREPKDKFKGR